MNFNLKIKWFICFLIPVLFLTSCTFDITQKETSPSEHIISMEEKPVLDYEVPQYESGILIDRMGYNIDSRKIAVMHGINLPSTFQIVDVATKEAVYTGKIENRGYNNIQGEYNSYGDFTEFTQTGTYYIECDIIGRSYPFEIGNDVYAKTFENIMNTLKDESGKKDFSLMELTEQEQEEWMTQIILIMMAYELYPDIHQDTDSNQVPDILDITTVMIKNLSSLQEIQTGEVHGWEYAYAAVLAKYSYIYQKFDKKFATEALNLADKAWRRKENYIQNQEEVKDSDQDFGILAAAELYRATGQYKYRNYITEYSKEETRKTKQDILAEITYLSTKQWVDVELCSRFMKELMLEAEAIAVRNSNSINFNKGPEIQKEMDEFIWDVLLLSVVEYVITNHEYGQIIENQYHYLMGHNLQSICYWRKEEKDTIEKHTIEKHTIEKDTIEKEQIFLNDNKVWTAGALMMMSEILTNK